MDKRLIFEKDKASLINTYFDQPKFYGFKPQDFIPQDLLRKDLPLPNLSEPDVVRHYSNLAKLNFSVDSNFYPLGSCTMKYNPKINEEVCGFKGYQDIHPYQQEDTVQGALALMYDLEKLLCEITGMSRFSFQPSSGAQGELAGILMVNKYHKLNQNKKTKIIIPDSAHGTNPATAAMCGYDTVVVQSNSSGLVDLDKLEELTDQETAAIMLTNPNTLGLFEEDILKISEIIHERGGLLYYDGANFNPLLGITKPSFMGFDIVHLNLHKTFSTPHGCGGPGAGVIGVKEQLVDYLPMPLIDKKDNTFCFNYNVSNSIGRVRTFYGNFSVLVRAYAYILRLGSNGLKRVSENSVLAANYLKEKLKKHFEVVYPGRPMHEVVFSCVGQKEKGVRALDIAKRLIDFGIHPPTMYFPLIVSEALMVEPTETESKETLDYFIETMININKEIDQDIEKVKTSPHTTAVKRVDEVKAARFPKLKCQNLGA